MTRFSVCAVTLVLVIALVTGAADELHDVSSLEPASPTDDLKSLSKEQLLAFLTGQVADLKKQNAAHEMQVADLQKQNAAREEQNAAREEQNAALKARLDGASRLAAAKNDELGEQTMMQTVMQERWGFGGMMTSGSNAVQSSGMEKKELGEVALVSDPEPYVKSTLEYGKMISSTNGLGPSACSDPFSNCNPALCEGQIPGFSGGLNCPNFTSTECPDDLSGLKFFKVMGSGEARCTKFTNKAALQSILVCKRYETGRICTKAAIKHPHHTAKHVVAIMFKRLVCSGDPEKCFTYKMGYCISHKNSDPYFSAEHNFHIHLDEYKAASKMLKGDWTDIFDTENGGIKDEWACGDGDTQTFKDTLMAF